MPPKRKEQASNIPATRPVSTDLGFLPPSVLSSLAEEAERGFFNKAFDLVTSELWMSRGSEPTQRIYAAREFSVAYIDLLEWVFVEYVTLLAKVIANSGMIVPWRIVETATYKFCERFVSGCYRHPWTGEFLIFGNVWISKERAVTAYRRLHETASWFDIRVVTPDCWEHNFVKEVRTGNWRWRAVREAKRKVKLLAITALKPLEEPAGSREREIATAVPAWDELKKRKSISQSEAAEFLRWTTKTIRNRVTEKRLTKAPSGRIACDDKLITELRKRHGMDYR